MVTLEELKAYLATTYGECDLIDLLNLSTFDLVEFLEESIKENFDNLVSEMELLEEDGGVDADQ
jgi:hypothetical protein